VLSSPPLLPPQFRCSIKELERRLGSVLNQGFDDCATVFASFKLIESFEGLLEREFIQADLERKHLELLKAYGKDLRDVQDTFTRQRAKSAEGFYLERAGPPLYMNMPPVAGALYWARGLLDRVREPMEKLTAMLKVRPTPSSARARDATRRRHVCASGLARAVVPPSHPSPLVAHPSPLAPRLHLPPISLRSHLR
jgi:hypothetical protein